MNPKQEAWGNAKWIGGGDEDLVFYPHALSVFKLSYAIQLDEASNSTKASFIFGANDDRLMDKNKNIFGLQSIKDLNLKNLNNKFLTHKINRLCYV